MIVEIGLLTKPLNEQALRHLSRRVESSSESSSRPAVGPGPGSPPELRAGHCPPRGPLTMISLHQTRVRHAGAEVCNLLALFDTPDGWTEHCPAWASPLYVPVCPP